MKSLGEFYNVDGANNARIVEAWTNTENSKIFAGTTVQRVVNCSTDKPDCTRPIDLNIKDLESAKGKHLIDIILEYDGQIDVNEVVSRIQSNNYSELPIPFCENSSREYFHLQEAPRPINLHMCAMVTFLTDLATSASNV